MPDPAALTRHLCDQIATGNRATLEGLLAEDFRLVGSTRPLGRAEWIKTVLSANWDTVDIVPINATVELDQTAVVTATVQHHPPSHVDPPTRWLIVDVWHRRGVDWKLLSRTAMHSSH